MACGDGKLLFNFNNNGGAMNKIDLIIDALESAHHTNDTGVMGLTKLRLDTALAAAHELKALKPVAYMDRRGILFNWTTHPHLNIALYALDEVKHD